MGRLHPQPLSPPPGAMAMPSNFRACSTTLAMSNSVLGPPPLCHG